MKEQYQAFITASLLFLSAEKAGEVTGIVIPAVGGIVCFVIVSIACVSVFRGLYVLLPYPVLWEERDDFQKAFPEAYLKSRSEQVLLYKRWKKEKAEQ
jgi:hypothetical protein